MSKDRNDEKLRSVSGGKSTLVYREVVSPKLTQELYAAIYKKIVLQKRYTDPDYSAIKLAKELNTNTRYLSAVVNTCFKKNYSALVNELRIEDAKQILDNPMYARLRIEDVGNMVGYSTRQCFYTAFRKHAGLTPRQYKLRAKLDLEELKG